VGFNVELKVDGDEEVREERVVCDGGWVKVDGESALNYKQRGLA